MSPRDVPRSWFRAAALVVAAVALALAVQQLRAVKPSPRALLAQTDVWTYQLQNIELARLARSPSDLLVIDYAHATAQGTLPLSAADVQKLKSKPGGARRLVVAYLSIGEAEEYRPYWRSEWSAQPPEWLAEKNCRWPDNHLVRFWHDDWKRLIYAGADSYLAQIQAAGFDGVYLDRVDVHAEVTHPQGKGREAMVAFVRDLAAVARGRSADFLIIAQNAEELIDDPAYRRAIDAVAKEDLLYGLAGTGKRNADEQISWSSGRLQQLKREGKPVFAVEYLTTAEAIGSARRELEALGFVPVFPTRALDGADPLAIPAAPADESAAPAAAEKGTPEFATSNCAPRAH